MGVISQSGLFCGSCWGCAWTTCGCELTADASTEVLIGLLIRNCCMDLLQACDEIGLRRDSSEADRKLEADPDNYSKLEEGLLR